MRPTLSPSGGASSFHQPAHGGGLFAPSGAWFGALFALFGGGFAGPRRFGRRARPASGRRGMSAAPRNAVREACAARRSVVHGAARGATRAMASMLSLGQLGSTALVRLIYACSSLKHSKALLYASSSQHALMMRLKSTGIDCEIAVCNTLEKWDNMYLSRALVRNKTYFRG